MQTDMTLREVALSYVARGWPCFPCRAKDEEAVDRVTGQTKYDPETGEVEVLKVKTPITDNGFKAATRFEHIIKRWWQDNPDAMVGIPTGDRIGAWVLDIDPRHGGNETLAALEAEYEPLPPTLSSTTAGGGRHFYFRHVEGVRNRGNLGEGIDVRGSGGYVIAPGSVTVAGGRYEWENDLEPAPAPPWLLDLVVRRHEPTTTAAPCGSVTNSAYVNAAVDRELADLTSAPMGSRNNHLNDAAFCLGTFVGAGALPESEARALLQDVARGWGRDWARCCKTIENGLAAGQRSPREIPSADQNNDNTRLVSVTRMIENGLRKAKERERGERRTENGTDAQKDDAAHSEPSEKPIQTSDTAPPRPAIVFTPYVYKDPRTLPRREFAFGTHYIRKYVSVTVAPGGLGKTANSIVEALAMVSGRALNGTKPTERLRVQLFNSEDPRDELERRIQAAGIKFNLKPEDMEGLFLDTGREQELVIAVEDKRSGVRIVEPIVEAVVEQIRAHKIDVMIVDPFVSTHQVNENDNGAIDKVAKLWAQIADQTNCAIDIVHHLRKLADREATVEDARGAVSLIGAARSVRVLNRMTTVQAKEAGLQECDRYGYFNIHYGKSNLTPLSHKLDWRHLESIALGNGTVEIGPGGKNRIGKQQDHAPVVTEWKWPSSEEVAALLTGDEREHIVTLLDNGSYKEARNAKDWAGYAVAYALGLDKEDDGDKRKAGAVLKAMMDEGMLVKSEERDPVQRKNSSYIRSATWREAA